MLAQIFICVPSITWRRVALHAPSRLDHDRDTLHSKQSPFDYRESRPFFFTMSNASARESQSVRVERGFAAQSTTSRPHRSPTASHDESVGGPVVARREPKRGAEAVASANFGDVAVRGAAQTHLAAEAQSLDSPVTSTSDRPIPSTNHVARLSQKRKQTVASPTNRLAQTRDGGNIDHGDTVAHATGASALTSATCALHTDERTLPTMSRKHQRTGVHRRPRHLFRLRRIRAEHVAEDGICLHMS